MYVSSFVSCFPIVDLLPFVQAELGALFNSMSQLQLIALSGNPCLPSERSRIELMSKIDRMKHVCHYNN